MQFSEAEIRHVAALARLRLTEEEVAALAGELRAILDYVAKLEELDTTGVEPTSQAVAVKTPLRSDAVTSASDPDAMLANAPERYDNFFVVPSIIE